MAKSARKEVSKAAAGTQLSKELRVQATLGAALKQAKLNSLKMHPAALKYLSTLINPDFTRTDHVRIPDGYSRPTALIKSRHIVPVIPNYASGTADADLGRFCAVVTPSMLSAPWLYGAVNGFSITREEPYVSHAVPLTAFATPGFHVGWVNPEFAWNPDAVFNVPPGNITVPEAKKNQLKSISNLIPSKKVVMPEKTSTTPEIGPIPIPSTNGWSFEADPNADVIAGTAQITAADSTVVNTYYENGMASAMRCVGMSVWFKCTRAQLNNGGNVSACLMPADSALGSVVPYNWITTTGDSTTDEPAIFGGQGTVLNWENLARVPDAYNGKLGDGSYTYWVPQRLSDIDMLAPGAMANTDTPYIVVSGQVSDMDVPTAGTPAVVCGELIVDSVWEYLTVSQIPEQKKSACVPNVLDQVKCALYNQPTSMANGDHKKWLTGILRTAGGAAAGFLTGGPAGAILGATNGIITSINS